jgi:hypothetical protein
MMPKTYGGENIASSINGAGKTGPSYPVQKKSM